MSGQYLPNQGAPFTATSITLDDSTQTQSISAILPLISKTDVASATITYTGYALRGAASSAALWFIFRDTISGNVTSREMASDPWIFDQIWDSRAGLSYS